MSVPSNRFSEKDLEAATGGVLLKKGDLRNFIEKESLAQVFSCEFKKKKKEHLFYRTPLVNILLWKFDTSWKVHYCRLELKISPNVRVPMKTIPCNLAFSIVGIIELYTRKVCSIFVYEHM